MPSNRHGSHTRCHICGCKHPERECSALLDETVKPKRSRFDKDGNEIEPDLNERLEDGFTMLQMDGDFGESDYE